eukprot:1567967-Pyramimonas_sp.AAC.1
MPYSSCSGKRAPRYCLSNRRAAISITQDLLTMDSNSCSVRSLKASMELTSSLTHPINLIMRVSTA